LPRYASFALCAPSECTQWMSFSAVFLSACFTSETTQNIFSYRGLHRKLSTTPYFVIEKICHSSLKLMHDVTHVSLHGYNFYFTRFSTFPNI
jgi:hypothetical protein